MLIYHNQVVKVKKAHGHIENRSGCRWCAGQCRYTRTAAVAVPKKMRVLFQHREEVKEMTLLAAITFSAIVSFVIARCYLIRAMKRLEKVYVESIDQMEKVSLDFMSRVKEQTEEMFNQISKR